MIPGLGGSAGEGNDNPLHYSCLENSKERGVCWATVHRFAKSCTWLSDQHFHFLLFMYIHSHVCVYVYIYTHIHMYIYIQSFKNILFHYGLSSLNRILNIVPSATQNPIAYPAYV